MSRISFSDARVIREARKAGVLSDVAEDFLDLSQGAITVPCADGDQGQDLRRFVGLAIERQCGFERDHDIGINGGGALTTSPRSPLRHLGHFLSAFLKDVLGQGSKWKMFLLSVISPFIFVVGWCLRQDFVVLVNIWGGIKLKDIKTVMLYTHFPCGAAGLVKMDAWEQFRHLVLAKQRLKRLFGHMGVKVPCLVHVDYGPEDGGKEHRKRTYFVKTHTLEAWLKSKGVKV